MIYHAVLENSRIALRALEPSDVDTIYKWENDTSLWLMSSTQTPFSRDTIVNYIENSFQDIYSIKQLRLIIDSKELKQAVGAIDLYDFDPNNRRAGVGILVSKEFRHQGFAASALERLIDYGAKVLNLHQIFASVAENNTESLKLFENAGFAKTGTRKEWIRTPDGWLDEYVYQFICG